MRRPLRIALPKGRLLDQCITLFAAAGLPVPSERDLRSRKLVFRTGEFEWILVKDGDVPVYVEYGAADAGVAGLDQVLEHQSEVYQPVKLPFGQCRMMLIGSPDAPPLDDDRVDRIATKYPVVTRNYLNRRGLHLDIIPLQGSVELSAVLGLTPYIVDLVETGETIRIHALQPLDTIEEISPYLIVNRSSYRIDSERIRELTNNISAAAQGEVAV